MIQSNRALHHAVGFLGDRAMSVGLVHLCVELQRSGVLDPGAAARIKQAIAKEVSYSSPRYRTNHGCQREMVLALDRLIDPEPVAAIDPDG